MLKTLCVRNFAIIDRLDIEFGGGFNVLTGETGAGKSILIDALGLILGGRAGAEMVRAGADRAFIDAVFDLSGSPGAQDLVREMGFEPEQEGLLLSREVWAVGKSVCRVGGRPASVSQLKEIGDWLVDLHGQHEHQSLLAVSRHLDMLDDWASRSIDPVREEVGGAFRRLQQLREEKRSLERDARERAHLLDLYRFQVKEISDADLRSGEAEELSQEQRRAGNVAKLMEAASVAIEALSGGERGGGALEGLDAAVHALEDGAALDTGLSSSLETVRSASFELAEAVRDLRHYQNSIEADPDRLAIVEERLDLIRRLGRKYGESVDEILRYAAETTAALDALENSEERGALLDQEIGLAETTLRERCARLSGLRRAAAAEFQSITLSELRGLALEKARFEVSIECMEPTARGADRVEFLISTNPGEPLKPLVKVASGGEISRVMLALKSALARQEALPTMVFDEIDVGVGGRTASVIADKMARLARSAQILCITHLATLASRAAHHFSIEKQAAGDRVTVAVRLLEAEDRVNEIARMLGGTEVTEAVLQHAREMLMLSISPPSQGGS